MVTIDHISSISQATIMKVGNIGGQPWIFTAVYGSTYSHIRTGLWDYLDSVPELHNLPWFITSDLNEILSLSDKKGGSYSGRIVGFKKWFDRVAMIDMGFQGPLFT